MEKEPQKNSLMNRYELTLDGHQAILEYTEQEDCTLVFTHTFVPPELRGRNVAAILTRFALEDVRALGRKVVARCSYVAVFLDRNKEYGDLRAAG